MKTLKMIGMVFAAVLLSANFISCSNDDEINENKQENKMLTIGLNCVGEILEIENSPLARSAGNDLYAIQVHQLSGEYVMDGETFYEKTPYAYGLFTDLTNVTIGLLDGFKYRFEASMAVDGYVNGVWFCHNIGESISYNTFKYSSSSYVYPDQNGGQYKFDRYYGRLDEYSPTTNGNAEIYMKRVSYGAKFVATSLTEGSLNINAANKDMGNTLYSLALTPETTIDDNIYTFNGILSAYQGTRVSNGYDSETGNPIFTYTDDYEETNSITFSWTKADGTTTPLGTYDIPFKRNVKTTVTIKVEEITNENGIIVTKEETAMTDDENKYQIEGGNITVIPVTGGN